ncbi:MAG: hypothetical protein KC502_08450, partial [Myxococcales bacterium]|nr:hypothetical protein [Myxococcales bacterium]
MTVGKITQSAKMARIFSTRQLKPAGELRERSLRTRSVWALLVAMLIATTTACSAEPETDSKATGSTCSVDGDCSAGDGCKAGTCTTLARDCTADPCPEAPCQKATCDRFAGCSAVPADTGAPCGKDRCASACSDKGACEARSSPVTCPEPGVCKTATCDPLTGKCGVADASDGATCDDGDACTGPDTCTSAACKGKAKDCNDDNACTKDGCTANGGCNHTPVDGDCDDGLACTPVDKCSGGQCVGKGATLFADGYGTASDEEAYAVVHDKNGYTLAGWTETVGGNIRGWLGRIADGGALTWQHTYGKGSFDFLAAAVARPGGGIVAAGSTDRNSDDDAWLLITDDKGAVIIDQAVVGKGNDALEALLPVGAGVVAGGATGKTAKTADGWVVSFDAGGKIKWQRTWGTDGADRVRALAAFGTGFVAVGETRSATAGAAGSETWVVKVAADGAQQWQVSHGVPADDIATSVVPAPGGGLIVAGSASGKARVLHLDSSGKLIWERVFPGEKSEFTGVTISDSAVVLVGDKRDAGSKIVRAWMVRMDLKGTFSWQRTWSSGELDRATGVIALADGLAVSGWGRVSGQGEQAILRRADLWGHTSCNAAAGCAVAKPSLCSDGNVCTA